jgi:hypothetical protein
MRETGVRTGVAWVAVVLGPLAPVLVVVWLVVSFRRHPDAASRAELLRRAGFVLALAAGAFSAVFAAGEAFDDPGGWSGLALVAAWAVPAVVLAFAAWRWPQRSLPLFVALTAGVIALEVARAVEPGGWRSFERGRGPVATIAALVVVTVTAFLAWRRPFVGGLHLLAIPLATFIVAATVGPVGSGMTAVAFAGLLPGGLFVLAAAYARGAAQPVPGSRPNRSSSTTRSVHAAS